MGCASCPCKVLINLLNTLLILIGLAIAGLGAALQAAGGSTFFKFLEDSIKSILTTVKVGEGNFAMSINFQQTFGPAGIILIVVGLVIACIAFLGCFGTTCCNPVLILYVIVLAVIIVAEIIVVSLFYSQALDGRIKDLLNSTLVNDYVDLDDSSLASIVWNVIMLRFGCCGLNGYQDFWYAKKWNATRSFTVSGEVLTGKQNAPIACCSTNGSFPSVTFNDPLCSLSNITVDNWNTGCWNAVTEFLNDENIRTYSILVCVGIMVVEAVIMLISIFIYKDNKSKL